MVRGICIVVRSIIAMEVCNVLCDSNLGAVGYSDSFGVGYTERACRDTIHESMSIGLGIEYDHI